MLHTDTDYLQELKPTYIMTLLFIGAAGLLLALSGDLLFGSLWAQALDLALLCWIVAGTGLLLLRISDPLSRTFTVTALSAVVLWAAVRLQAPDVLAWLVLPNLLAVTFLGVRAGVLLALGQTLALAAVGAPGVSPATLVLLWGILPVAGLLSRTLHQVFRWSVDYFQRADEVLKEARTRQEELNRAIAGLSQANQQLAQLNRLAQSLRQTADEALTAKERFVANVSHELRTPLNMVIGFSETILDSPTLYGVPIPPALLADLAVIHRNAEHLSSLIDDVLDLNQMETGQMTLNKEFVAYKELVEAAITAVRPLFSSKNLALQAEIAGDLAPVYCDPLRIREVLMNLLSNAGRFTETGGVTVRVWLEGHQLHTSVADTGLGIAPDKLPNLFQPFYQVDSSIRRRFGGTGLGLSISKRFVELHEGKIWVESCAGEGTTFLFRFPMTPAKSLGVHPLQKTVEGWEFYARTGPPLIAPAAPHPRYLVVDPSHTLARLLRRADLDAEVTTAASMAEAGALLAGFPAQMLLVNTPSVGATLDALGGSLSLPPGTPALFCTLVGNEGTEELSGSPGARNTPIRLVKPVHRQALLDAVSALGIERGVVLVVDDEPDALQLFGRILASAGEGFRILQARDGVEALAIMASVQPDLIVMDLVMPNMDGFQLLEYKSHDAALRDIPVIVVSAQDVAHQPILAGHVILGRGGGLSAGHLLKAIQFTTQMLDPGAPTAVAAPPTAPRG